MITRSIHAPTNAERWDAVREVYRVERLRELNQPTGGGARNRQIPTPAGLLPVESVPTDEAGGNGCDGTHAHNNALLQARRMTAGKGQPLSHNRPDLGGAKGDSQS